MKALKFKTSEKARLFSVSMRQDRLGNLFYFVEYDGENYLCFESFSSVLDFVKNNM